MRIFKEDGFVIFILIITVLGLGILAGNTITHNSWEIDVVKRGFAHYEVGNNRHVSFVWHTNIFLELKP